jgi:hypothetical protein
MKEQETLINNLKNELNEMNEQINFEAENRKTHVKRSESRKSPRVSRHSSLEDIHIQVEKKPSIKTEELVGIENNHSFQSIQEIKEDVLNE